MEAGESLNIRYFPLSALPSSLEGRAKIILERYFNES
jgi:hypothetical protein